QLTTRPGSVSTPLEVDAGPGVVLHNQATILQMLPDQLLQDVLRLLERFLVLRTQILTIEDDRHRRVR
uniref:Uncharacterized protein n=1 Tax=Anopheles dirus TaxID=7168 RepID=A0A182NYN8_9DIPT